MKRAVVLSGGGTRGSFELGVWRALRELGIDYQIVTGTSIGSINGAMMCIGNYERTEEMWLNLKMSDMLKEKLEQQNTVKNFFKSLVTGGFLRDNMIEGAVDNSPFADFIQKYIEEDKIRKSDIDFGLVTIRMRDHKPFQISKSEMPAGKIQDFVTASASVYPIFPLHEIDGDYFIDGCYHDNLPIDLSVKMGATEIIVVDLHQEPQHPQYAARPYVTYITPSEDLGPVLNFDQEWFRYCIEMGYRDAMRTFGKYKGYLYYFNPSGIEGYDREIAFFNEACLHWEGTINLNTKSKLKKAGNTYRMYELFEKYTRGKAIEKNGYFLRGAELAAEVFNLDHTRIWKMKDLINEALTYLHPESSYPDISLFTAERVSGFGKKVRALKEEKGAAYIAGCIYYAAPKDEVTYDRMLDVLQYLPKELGASMFLYSVTLGKELT